MLSLVALSELALFISIIGWFQLIDWSSSWESIGMENVEKCSPQCPNEFAVPLLFGVNNDPKPDKEKKKSI